MNKKQYQKMNWAEVESIVYSDCAHPFEILGAHASGKETLIQAFFPNADSVTVIFDDKNKKNIKMELVDEEGFFAAFTSVFEKEAYSFEVKDGDGKSVVIKDAYAFPCKLQGKEIASFQKGKEDRADSLFGAICTENAGVKGVLFRVYAPNAIRVSVIGEFDAWDGRIYPMEKDDKTGIFSLFIPGLKAGEEYAYEIKIKNGDLLVKRDPFATAFGTSNAVSCLVPEEKSFAWSDDAWMKNRSKKDYRKEAFNICQVNVSDMEEAGFDSFVKELSENLPKIGFTHVKFSGIWEYADENNYPVKSYFAVKDFLVKENRLMKLVDLCHSHGIGVIFDWSVAYFDSSEQGMGYFDGSQLYEHADMRKGYHPKYNAYLFQYGAPHVKSLLFTALRSMVEFFHVDGVCWDELAPMLYLDYHKNPGEWICNDEGGTQNLEAVAFLKEANAYLAKNYKGVISIGSMDAVWPDATKASAEGCLGFQYVMDLGYSRSMQEYLGADPSERVCYYGNVVKQGEYAFGESFILPLTIQAAVMPGILEDKYKGLKAGYAFRNFYPGKKVSEIDLKALFDAKGSEEPAAFVADLKACISRANALYSGNSVLYGQDEKASSFEWLVCQSYEDNVLAYMRNGSKKEDTLYVVGNFSSQTKNFTFSVPYPGKFKEIFTTENRSLNSAVATEELPQDEKQQTLTLALEPLSVSVLSYREFTEKELAQIYEKKKQLRIRYVKEERAKVEKERDAIIAAAIKDADSKIKELEKLLKEYK